MLLLSGAEAIEQTVRIFKRLSGAAGAKGSNGEEGLGGTVFGSRSRD